MTDESAGTRRSLMDLLGDEVVVDTDCSLVYVGRLEAVSDHFLILADTDVHEMSDSTTTKERYVLESRKYGVRKNRKEVLVARGRLVSVSRLEDVISF